MAEDKISASIIKQAEEKAAEILAEAEKKAAKIKSKGQQEMDLIEKKQQHQRDLTYRREVDRIVSNAELEIRLADLNAKRSQLDKVFQGCLNKLLNKDKKYPDILKTIIVQEAITGNEEIIACADDQKYFTEEFLDSLHKEFSKGKGFKLSKKTANIKGGVFLTEGDVTIDASLNTIMQEEQYFLESKVAEILFGGDD